MAVVERNQEIQTLVRNAHNGLASACALQGEFAPVRRCGGGLGISHRRWWLEAVGAEGAQEATGQAPDEPDGHRTTGGYAGASGQLWSEKQAFPQKRFVASRNQDHSGGVKRKPQTTTLAVNGAAAAEQQRHPELDGT
jgi:hypothetical protein